MAPDQRYCLQCGSRRAHLPGVHEGLRVAAGVSASQREQASAGAAVTHPIAPAEPTRAGNTTSVIAGVGVLLLSMGVGVLIGRSASSPGAGKAAASPQVISVAPQGTAAATTPAATTTAPASTPAKKHGGSSSSSSSSGVGQIPSKPAPPTVLKNLRGGSGQSYEQKSKNLPNVISTG
jgi:hypothetical protein